MKADSTVKTWEKTRLQNMVRHKSGRYYARLFLNGKEIWKSLKTSHFSVAEAKLAEVQKEHRERRAREVDPSNAKMTFGQAAQLHLQRVADDVNLKRSTRKYCGEIHTALLKSWPALETTEIRRITAAACREWAARYAKQMSPTRFNGTLSFLRHVIDLAMENGVIFSNPATVLERVAVRSKRPEMPTRAKFAEFIVEMRQGHSRDSRNCADLAEGLAFTGCRIGEAKEIVWNDLDFQAGEIRVKGDPEEGTKNSEERTVPMIQAARGLFERMRSERQSEAGTEKVYLVHECQGAINRAAKKVGMKRITHHDLRHFFATICIESGVDIPTVSRWLGHKDGGALAMRTYGHLRREHSLAQAQKVNFAPVAAAA
jgi:integrase